MVEYLKCVYANKFCFVGFVSFVGLVVFIILISRTDSRLFNNTGVIVVWVILAYLSMFGLVGTAFGVETLNAYKRTKDHISRFDRVDEDFRFHTYCGRAGFRLAVKEAGIKI